MPTWPIFDKDGGAIFPDGAKVFMTEGQPADDFGEPDNWSLGNDGVIYFNANGTWIAAGSGGRGPQGFQGVAGGTGAQGSSGAQGNQGNQGAIGPGGGFQGSQGAPGAQGAAGTNGSQGSQGSQGGAGSQGNIGAQGALGSGGSQGSQGGAGSQGSQGAQGSQGSQGTAGSQGSQGTGAQGVQGAQGASGAVTQYPGTGTFYAAGETSTSPTTYGGVEMVIGNSHALGDGTPSGDWGIDDWATVYAKGENREAGLADPGLGFAWPCAKSTGGVYGGSGWNSVGNGTAVSAGYPDTLALQLSGTIGTSSRCSDTRVFRRAVVYVAQVTNGDGVNVSFDGGSTFVAIIDGNGPGIAFYDSGDLGASAKGQLAVQRAAHVSGSGGTAPVVLGVRYYTTAGTVGLVMDNQGAGGTVASDWTGNREWESYLNITKPRRLWIILGVNDMRAGTSASTFKTNLTTIVQRARIASPLTEIVLCSDFYGAVSTDTPVGYAAWQSTWLPVYAQVASANGCTYVGFSEFFGNLSYTRTVSDGVTHGNNQFTSATANFSSPRDVGSFIACNDLPPGTTITAVTNSTTVTMSNNSISGGTSTLATTIGGDLWQMTMDNGLHLQTPNSASAQFGQDGQGAMGIFARQTIGNRVTPVLAPSGAIVLTSGSTWVCPATGTYRITCIGGGGGGAAGSSAATNVNVGGSSGGASGGYTTVEATLVGGTPYTYAIGAAGTAGSGAQGAQGTAGGGGGVTTFDAAGGGFPISAYGGAGGQPNPTASDNSLQAPLPGIVNAAGLNAAAVSPAGTVLPGVGGFYIGPPFRVPEDGFPPWAGGSGSGGGSGAATSGSPAHGGTAGSSGRLGYPGAKGTTAGMGSAAGGSATSTVAGSYGAGGGAGGAGTNNQAGGNGAAGGPGAIFIERLST